ncbi:MAG: diguanylate cyclase [Candidatus Eremiobacteraeota bacterium]|nr:diguanylate cyclase [Candidatus Eremiobacteraeota bacterium]
MLSFDARDAPRQELYRDLVYGTAELVSRSLPMDELLESAVDLGKSFFNASSLEIKLLDADLMEGGSSAGLYGVRSQIEQACFDVMRTGVTHIATDATSMHAPIRFGDDVRGVISIVASAGMTFDDVDASLFDKWASLLGVRIAELHLRADNARLEVLAGIDGLTGIYNRRAFGEMLAPAWGRASRSNASLAIAMIDVDFFKSFNDKYGHVAGDTCLKQIAKSISLSLRGGDVLGRYGGEEFAVFFEGSTLDVAIEVAERLRENIYALGIPHLGSRLGRVTASVGVAAVVPRAGDDPSTLLERADAALYGAKERGRNRVVAEAYVSASSAALPRQEVRSNLPRLVSSFCGRHDDVGRVRSALGESRLVTLTGFGGVGKTRLALEVATELAATFRDGAWFVDLAGTRDAKVIPALVAAALEVRDPLAAASAGALAERCRHKAALLVLDNCEHLKDACAAFAATMLRAAPRVRILATSREPLDTAEEVVLGLAPFAVPGGKLTACEALRVPAIRLFIDRARAVTDFELDESNVAAVVDLCRRVDGIALGIELAAARLKMLSLEQLQGKLDRRFGVLARTGAGRQQTLRALIDWSFELLSPRERALFTRLGVFAGSFTLEAATAICGDDELCEGHVDHAAVLGSLDALVDKSLLVVETRRDGAHTFRLFASIRSYARDRLTAAAELESVESRHRDYYLAAATAAEARRRDADWLTALRPLENAGDDLRAVLESTLGKGRYCPVGAELASKLVDYWQRQGMVREGRAWLECALASEDASFSAELRACVRLALLDLQPTGTARAGRKLAFEALEAISTGADERLAAVALYHLGKVHSILGEVAAANENLRAAQHKAESCADSLTLARASNLQGTLAILAGDAGSAVTVFTRSEQLYRRINRESLAVYPLGNLAEVAHGRQCHQEAIELAKRALAIAERDHDRGCASWLLGNLGCYYLAAGDDESAASFTRDGLRMALEVDDEWQALNSADTYARISYERGDFEIAALLLGYAEHRLAALRVPRQPVDQQRMSDLVVKLRATLGPMAVEQLLARGGALSRDAMLELVDPRAANISAALSGPAGGGEEPTFPSLASA